MNTETQDMFFIIADISGYTKFMLTPDIELVHLQGIISDLLHAVIEQIEIPLKIAKFEGDAVFMYAPKDGMHDWDEVKKLLSTKLCAFIDAFDEKLRMLAGSNHCDCASCLGMGKLQLKVLAHYGQALHYEIGGHTELSGIDVIVIHRLLKNHVPSNKYILLSEVARTHLDIDMQWHKGIESYPEDIGDVVVYWLVLDSVEITVVVDRYNIIDFFRKMKYRVMSMFPRYTLSLT